MFRPPRSSARHTAGPARPTRAGRAALGRIGAGALLGAAWLACTTSPTGRSQLLAFDDRQLDRLGAQAFALMQAQMPTADDEHAIAFVRCVAEHVVGALPPEAAQGWEVAVFRDDSANAFALPGGYIGVNTGILDVATAQDQLAVVISHEVSHVLAQHANERMSTTAVAETGLAAAGAVTGASEGALAALGLGAQVGVLLPYSRAQESEADVLGLELMAKAGFDPRAAADLWRKMAQQGDGGPPEFLSTHPSSESRIEELSEEAPQYVSVFQQAVERRGRPDCG